MENLFSNTHFLTFLVRYGASAAWNITEAGIKGMMQRFRRQGGRDIVEAFQELRQDEQLKRDAQHLINNVLKGLPEDQKERVAQDADWLANVVFNFLTESQAGKPPITQQLRDAILERMELPDGTDEAAIASFTASVILAVADDKIADAVRLGAIEQVQDTVNTGFEMQFAMSNDMMSKLSAGFQDIKQQMGSSFSPSPPSSEAVAKYLANNLTDFSALLKHIGIQTPASIYADTKTAFSPPQLSQGHVERKAVCKQIENMLAQHPILAVTGYPECGKTLALAEFASEAPECFWLDFPPNLSSGIQAMQLLDIALSNYLESKSASPSAIIAALHRRLTETSLLIVIDNAERLDDVDLLQPLIKVAETVNGRLRILMAYAEMPDFTVAAKLARIPTWRLPGMEPHEAAELYQTAGITITQPRLITIKMLCAQHEGHVGMLRLYSDDIEAIQTNADIPHVIGGARDKPTARDFLGALALRFMESLSTEELLLCRRLSIAITPFGRQLAEALWRDGSDKNVFPVVWGQCKSGVLERVAEDRYCIPFLYRTPLSKELSDNEANDLHQVAADTLLFPTDNIMMPDDAFSCVYHYIQAGRGESAIRVATMLLANALSADRVDILRILSGQLSLLVTDDFLKRDITIEGRIIWFAFAGQVAHRCENVDRFETCVRELVILLDGPEIDGVRSEVAELGWATVLSFASLSKQPDLAWKAIDRIKPGFLIEANGEETRSPLLPLFFASLNSSEAPTDFVLNLLRRAEAGKLTPEQIWDNGQCWEVWRGVGAALYSHIVSLHSTDSKAARSCADELWHNVEKCSSLGFEEMSIILGVISAQIEIDVFRDMKRAVSQAQILVNRAGSLLARVRGLALMGVERPRRIIAVPRIIGIT